MLISRKWLSQYMDLEGISSEKIADTLTDLGLEVEEVTEVAPLDDKVVVGRVVKAEPHPNADTLKVCEVSLGEGAENISIVCGAPNARDGLTVAVAQVGAKLPGDFKIKKSKIRSVPSFGMLCSEKELEISDENDGIWEVDGDKELGQKINTLFDTSDSIFDVSLTPNRSDCLSYKGIARELGAKFSLDLKCPDLSYKTSSFKTSEMVTPLIKREEDSGRLVCLGVKGVKVSPSPLWLQKAMEASGLRSVNNIVDLTNYVMLEMGQPVHAYDRRDLEGDKLEVRSISKDTDFKTLDDKTVKLIPGDIVIQDSKKVVGVAGVMGGKDSEVKDDTSEIIIEVAEFDPGAVRKTSKRLALHTEASHRFERGIDIDSLDVVAKRLAHLIQACQNDVEIASEMVDLYSKPRKEQRVALRVDRARKLLAMPLLKTKECAKVLESIGIKLLDQADDRMLFSIPSWRHDLVREVDLIEEVGRLVGFDKIKAELPRMNIQPNGEDSFVSFQDECRSLLASLGLCEVITYPFSSHEDYSKLLCTDSHVLWPSCELQNPLSEKEGFMQTSLLPSLLKSTLQNRNHGDEGSKVFELGRSYFDSEAYEKTSEGSLFFESTPRRAYLESNHEKVVLEKSLLSGVLDSPKVSKSWENEENPVSFFDGKRVLETFFKALNIKEISYQRPDGKDYPFLHPGRSAVLMSGETLLGFLGELHPKASSNFGFSDEPLVAFELDLERLERAIQSQIKIEASAKKFPVVTRDFSFLVKEDLSYGDFYGSVFSNPRTKHLSKVDLFDVYEGDKVPEGMKSFAARFTYQSNKKTLGEKEINRESDFMVEFLKDKIGAEQR